MVREAKRVPVKTGDDVMRVLEDVRRDHKPRIVERNGEGIAAIVPLDDASDGILHRPTPEEVEAAFAAVGSWSDVDTEALKRSIREGRKRGSRPMTRPA